MTRRRLRGFTLVELLVVIGIIALLVSILLPSLNQARQAANLIDCQSRLHEMGQALMIYTSESKGLLPWAVVQNNAAWTDHSLPNPRMQEDYWWWMFTLGQEMSRNSIVGQDGFVHNLSAVFHDKDTIDPYGQPPNWISHYTCNPRIFYQANDFDYAPQFFSNGGMALLSPQNRSQRRITSVKDISDVFVIWDGPQYAGASFNSYPIAPNMDADAWFSTSGYCLGAPFPSFKWDRAIPPGSGGSAGITNGKALQKTLNIDLKADFSLLPDGDSTDLRFRHKMNTTLAALCLDGHTTTRVVGSVMVKDIYSNYPYGLTGDSQ